MSAYDWVDNDALLAAACLTGVVGVSAEEVVRRFGADLMTERSATFDDAFNDMSTARLVFDDVHGGVLVAENNGWEGSRPEVVEAVSDGSRVASIYWNVNAVMRFTYAENGVVVACFDPLFVEQTWIGADPASIRERASDLEFGVERPLSDSLTLIERLTGVGFERSWFEQPHRCVAIP
jgi:hypothetical protein